MATIRMDLQYFAGEKTEKATTIKKQESRKKGQVAKSSEIPSAIIFLSMFILFYILGPNLSEKIFDLYNKVFQSYLNWEVTQENVRLLFLELLVDVVWIMLPIFLVAVIAAIGGNLIQVGFLFTTEPLKMKLERINPIEGAKRIFSKRALVQLIKSLLKIIIVAYVSFLVIMDNKSFLLTLYYYDLLDILKFIGNIVLEIGFKVSLILLAIAILDYVYQKYDYEKNLRMSKQDIKDEYKKTEGDPIIKGRIKERQRQMAMRRMMQAVPDADVIITNPTHFAVAISYRPKEMDAPKLTAKGMDYVALKIKEVAKEHDIATVENKLLARTLYHQVEIGGAIPTELYQAVAEVLAYVYKIRGNLKNS